MRAMGKPLAMPPPGFDDLPVEERIDYVQALWDRIAAEAGQVPLQEWQLRLLDERTASHWSAPDASSPWADVLDRLESRLRRS